MYESTPLDREAMPQKLPPPEHLRYEALQGCNTEVYEQYLTIPPAERHRYRDRHIYYSALHGGLDRLARLRVTGWNADGVAYHREAKQVEALLEDFASYCNLGEVNPRELHECLLGWVGELKSAARFEEINPRIDQAVRAGIGEYPDLYARAVLEQAKLLLDQGKLEAARNLLSNLLQRYYVVPDKNTLAKTLHLLGQASLLTGAARNYTRLLFAGLWCFYTDRDTRRLFTRQLVRTYRNSVRLYADNSIPVRDKALFLVHWLDYVNRHNPILTKTGADRLTRLAVLATVELLNRLFPGELAARLQRMAQTTPNPEVARPKAIPAPISKPRSILVTRAMGGIGDLLMMTPGLHALKQKYPHCEIELALPRRYHPLFAGNEDVQLVDIQEETLCYTTYQKWFNLTDCPAAKAESRTAPRVRKNRIELFAEALGAGGWRLRKAGRRPRYFISEEERVFQKEFWRQCCLEGKTVCGVQVQAAETYRDYPYMGDLVRRLSHDLTVILFHGDPIEMRTGATVLDPGRLPLRRSFALAAACDCVIAPDSALVHLAGALDLPCIVLSGPIDGRIRTADYPRAVHVDTRKQLKCVPCWRNEIIPCALTGKRNSGCLAAIPLDAICNTLEKVLRKRL